MKRSANKKGLAMGQTIIFVLLGIYALSVMAMYIWAFLTSLNESGRFTDNVLSLPKGMPWEWAWENYFQEIGKIQVNGVNPFDDTALKVGFDIMLMNSLLYTIAGSLINNLTMWVVAYLVTRFSEYKTSKVLYTLVIALMTIPIIGNQASALQIYSKLGWYNNYLFIVVNNIAFTGMYFLIYVSFIKGLGKEFYESAYMDGAGNFTVMTKIALPLTSSMFFVVLLLLSILRWNDYMTMLVYMPDYPTLAYGIYKATTAASTTAFTTRYIAVCVVLMIPLLILFLFFQKPIMGNLRLGALKG